MKRFRFLFSLVFPALLMLLAACGNSSSVSSSPTPTPTPSYTPTPAHAASNNQGQCTTSTDNKVKACISRTTTGAIQTSYHIDCDSTTSKNGGTEVINEVKNGQVDPAHGNNGGSGGTQVKCGDGNGPTYTTSAPGTAYTSTVTAFFDNKGVDSIDSPQV